MEKLHSHLKKHQSRSLDSMSRFNWAVVDKMVATKIVLEW